MLENVYVVVGSTISDIGKGWLTGSIASSLSNAIAVKFDPMLNTEFPYDIGINIDGKSVSSDLLIYKKLGLPVHPDYNIVAGALKCEFFNQETIMHYTGRIQKLDQTYLSHFLAEKLSDLTDSIENCENLVIEIGGCVTDTESSYVPGALKALRLKKKVEPKMIILSCLEYAETDQGHLSLKTNIVRQSIRYTERYYPFPIEACFVRRRHVPENVTDEQIEQELMHMAEEIFIESEKIKYLSNASDVEKLKKIIEKEGFLKKRNIYGVSACLLGIPCRYKNEPEADSNVVNYLKKHGYLAVCPEFLAGLGVPRGPFEISNGDGYDVLDGKAKVISKDGTDYTYQFITGAEKALEQLKQANIKQIVLKKAGSGSCACEQIYDGTFTGILKDGCGVFTALVKRNDIKYTLNTDL